MTLEILRVYYTENANFKNFELQGRRDSGEVGSFSESFFFHFPVASVDEAKLVLKAMDGRHKWLAGNHSWNFFGLETLDEEANEWKEWRDEQGRDITKLIKIDEINAA